MIGASRHACRLLALALALVVARNDQAQVPLQPSAPACGNPRPLAIAMARELARGRPAEAASSGACLAAAALRGDIPAALQLADAYHQAMSARTPGALTLDMFGRHIGWLRIAAERDFVPAQLLLAQETDAPTYRGMPEMSLAWYQAAAESGSAGALAAICAAYAKGRIPQERLYDLRNWLAARTGSDPLYRGMSRVLGTAPTL